MDRTTTEEDKVLSEVDQRIQDLIYSKDRDNDRLDIRRIDFLRFLFVQVHEEAGSALICVLEEFKHESKILSKLDKDLGTTISCLVEQRLMEAEAAYDLHEANKEYLFKAKKAVQTWRDNDEEKFDYDEYIKFIEQRIKDF